jgi:hypothetical protein
MSLSSFRLLPGASTHEEREDDADRHAISLSVRNVTSNK